MIEYFTSLHKILFPTINIHKIEYQSCNINYYDDLLKINYSFDIDKSIINFEITSLNDISFHIKRLLNIKKISQFKTKENDITDFLFLLNNLIENAFDYCTICSIELKIKGFNKINCCDNSNCIKTSYQTVIDNKVTDAYKQDPHVFLFLLNILIAGTTHPKGDKIYKPLPMINDINDLNGVIELIKKNNNFLNSNEIVKILNESDTDFDLLTKTNIKVYSILKNAISNNHFSMSSKNDIEMIKSNKYTKIDLNGIKLIHISYSADIENKFMQKYFLFHGSKIYSWYPIIKNGLRVMSGTEFQANGAAYGNGIYFSDSLHMSHSYASNNHNELNVVGVFEVLEEPSKYKKNNGIFVIDDDKIILLRTLVLTNNNIIPKYLTDYLLKEMPIVKQTNKINVITLKNKRLSIEYNKLLKLDFITKIQIQNQSLWQIDFKPIKSIDVSVEIIFSNYPLNPPIVKIINTKIIDIKIINKLNYSNDHLNNLINPSNWKITSNLIDIMIKLYDCLNQSF